MQTPSTPRLGKPLAHILLGLVLSACIYLPDALYGLVNSQYSAHLSFMDGVALWLASLLLLGTPWKTVAYAIIALIAHLQLGQLLYFSYFGTHFHPQTLGLLLSELDEIGLTLSSFIQHLWFPLGLVLASALINTWLWHRSRGHVFSSIHAPLVLLFLLAILPYQAYHTSAAHDFYPQPTETSLRNALYAVSFFIGRNLAAADPSPHYAPYAVHETHTPEPAIIVLVMGESLTYKHMQLFGYARETTPRLMTWRDAPSFVYRPAIAAGVSTRVSLPHFFNIVREPGNLPQITRGETNLIRLAQAHGMKTYYISVQTADLVAHTGGEHADLLLTQEDLLPDYERKKDDILLEQLARLPLDEPALIVLHQRNSHHPYEKSSLPHYWVWPIEGLLRHEYTVNSYDNAIRHTDALLDDILHQLRERSRLPAYFIFTADHGEMMGEHGRYGHTLLEPDVARVPFLFYTTDEQSVWLRAARQLEEPSHYEIGLLLARMLGFHIDNPNDDGRTVFVSGADLGGGMGWMEVERRPGGAFTESQVQVKTP
ncbi:phosphoethanolamine transferase [Thiofaba sp. EF100]|uniref:phosphoethanolamine transferase n=1 Tax=Thiofaba sp. EF100 TaxID=3121274 RepID=UPI0032215A03